MKCVFAAEHPHNVPDYVHCRQRSDVGPTVFRHRLDRRLVLDPHHSHQGARPSERLHIRCVITPAATPYDAVGNGDDFVQLY